MARSDGVGWNGGLIGGLRGLRRFGGHWGFLEGLHQSPVAEDKEDGEHDIAQTHGALANEKQGDQNQEELGEGVAMKARRAVFPHQQAACEGEEPQASENQRVLPWHGHLYLRQPTHGTHHVLVETHPCHQGRQISVQGGEEAQHAGDDGANHAQHEEDFEGGFGGHWLGVDSWELEG